MAGQNSPFCPCRRRRTQELPFPLRRLFYSSEFCPYALKGKPPAVMAPASGSELIHLLGSKGPSALTILGLRNLSGFQTLIFFQFAKLSGAFFALTFLRFFLLTGLLPLTYLRLAHLTGLFSTLIFLQLGELSGHSTLTILEFRNLSGFWILFFEIRQISGTASFAISANAGFQTKMQDFIPRERELCQWTYAGRSPGSH